MVDGLNIIIGGIIALVIGLGLKYFVPEPIVQKIGYALTIIGAVLIIIGVVLWAIFAVV